MTADQKKTASLDAWLMSTPGQLSEKSLLLTEAMTSYTSETQSSMDDDDEDDNDSTDSCDEDESTFEDYASNILFLLGSILFVWLAIWDLMEDDFGWNDDDDSDDDDGYTGSPLKIIGTMVSDPYVALSAIAALLYVFDGCFQVAKLFCHNNIPPGSGNDSLDMDNEYEAGLLNHSMKLLSPGRTGSLSEYNSFSHNNLSSINRCNVFWKRRGKCMTSFLIGSTFGIAAFLDLVSGLIVDWDEDRSDMFDMVAVHLYLVNALILTAPIFMSLCCPRPKTLEEQPTRQYLSEKLEYVGDLLFLAGSLIDVMCSYINLDSTAAISDWFFLLSAVLWLIDAIFYVAADWIAFHEDDEDDTPLVVPLNDSSDRSQRSSGISLKWCNTPSIANPLKLQDFR
jgi:hypothetical protein